MKLFSSQGHSKDGSWLCGIAGARLQADARTSPGACPNNGLHRRSLKQEETNVGDRAGDAVSRPARPPRLWAARNGGQFQRKFTAAAVTASGTRDAGDSTLKRASVAAPAGVTGELAALRADRHRPASEAASAWGMLVHMQNPDSGDTESSRPYCALGLPAAPDGLERGPTRYVKRDRSDARTFL